MKLRRIPEDGGRPGGRLSGPLEVMHESVRESLHIGKSRQPGPSQEPDAFML
jgi:hypothetical protein